jgi:hypothetical protein
MLSANVSHGQRNDILSVYALTPRCEIRGATGRGVALLAGIILRSAFMTYFGMREQHVKDTTPRAPKGTICDLSLDAKSAALVLIGSRWESSAVRQRHRTQRDRHAVRLAEVPRGGLTVVLVRVSFAVGGPAATPPTRSSRPRRAIR